MSEITQPTVELEVVKGPSSELSDNSSQNTLNQDEQQKSLDFFEKYLALWVAICMGIGILLSLYLPEIGEAINSVHIGSVSVPIGICLFFMMYPALLNLQLEQLKNVILHPKAILVTLISNWIIAPLLHALLANLILQGYDQLIVAVILLGSSPCTAMVLVWGKLAQANQEQNFINTSLNTITIIFLYAPIVGLLTGMQNITVDWIELLITVAVFIGVPLIMGMITKRIIIPWKGEDWFKDRYVPIIGKIAIITLLMTLIVLFSLNGSTIISHPIELLLVSAPLLILYPVMVGINIGITKLLSFKYPEAATTVIIGSSSHFEIAIATAIGLYGIGSDCALGTTMGLFWEVPIMLSLVYFLKYLNRKNFF